MISPDIPQWGDEFQTEKVGAIDGMQVHLVIVLGNGKGI